MIRMASAVTASSLVDSNLGRPRRTPKPGLMVSLTPRRRGTPHGGPDSKSPAGSAGLPGRLAVPGPVSRWTRMPELCDESVASTVSCRFNPTRRETCNEEIHRVFLLLPVTRRPRRRDSVTLRIRLRVGGCQAEPLPVARDAGTVGFRARICLIGLGRVTAAAAVTVQVASTVSCRSTNPTRG
jgi:hypothetical protein